MENYKITVRIMSIVLVGLWTGLVSADEATQAAARSKLHTAFAQCEKGLSAPLPKTAVSLRVLQRYYQKYEKYRDAALAITPDLPKAELSYIGQFVGEKTYHDMYEYCESELAGKVSKAEEQVAQLAAKTQAKAKARVDLIQKLSAQSQAFAAMAVDKYCAPYVQTEAAVTPDPAFLAKLQQDSEAYQNAKDQALKIYPGILQNKHENLMKDADTSKVGKVNKLFMQWFEYCENVFAEQQNSGTEPAAAEEDVALPDETDPGADADADAGTDDADADTLPLPTDEAEPDADADADAEVAPPAETETAAEEAPAKTPDEKTAAPATAPDDEEPAPPVADDEAAAESDGADEEFQAMRKALKADRLKTLEQEKRAPDYADNEDDRNNAKTWMYENEAGTECRIYTFKKDHTLANKKVVKDVCP